MTTSFATLVLGFGYPRLGTLDGLRGSLAALPVDGVTRALRRFVSEVEVLEMGQWEELHTRTLDLSPLFVPYVGHLTWGESYRRGAFMADLQRAQLDSGVDQRGELPDHIVPILEYLDRVPDPLPDLVEVLPRAVTEMRKDLRKAEPDNPYRHLLDALEAAIDAHLAQGAST